MTDKQLKRRLVKGKSSREGIILATHARGEVGRGYRADEPQPFGSTWRLAPLDERHDWLVPVELT